MSVQEQTAQLPLFNYYGHVQVVKRRGKCFLQLEDHSCFRRLPISQKLFDEMKKVAETAKEKDIIEC